MVGAGGGAEGGLRGRGSSPDSVNVHYQTAIHTHTSELLPTTAIFTQSPTTSKRSVDTLGTCVWRSLRQPRWSMAGTDSCGRNSC